ncbi:vesicular glutamate transporter 3-like isoform X1 [Acropora millepora]|uniref:vesicular glutamate transporter 3-like isoform X1 n=1 Tax=Acropora millepora TaxID=45264 RepID=UPI001CF2ECCE|nr:vesicular glutamate transporter 3-like isoform X1 [Acropora millepora]XP_044170621.1 vesicular glutamate transporter 3-like isoform X1 [Acropora millepora]
MSFKGIPKRYVLSMLIFWGFFTMYAIRTNINVAIGAMLKNHTVLVDGVETEQEAEFKWNSKLRGVVLGSFYYGYVALQIPGGWLAIKVGGTRLFGLAVLIASILTILTPVSARASVTLLIAVRVAEGLVLGVLFPCNHAIWSKWAPIMERTTLVSLAVTGCSVGSIFTMPVSGLLTRFNFDGGWPAAFYPFGLFGILWYAAWFLFVFESPSSHPTITKEEQEYIELSAVNAAEVTQGSVPWKSILTSPPVWGIVAGAFASDWGLYVLLICVPLFLLEVLHYEVAEVGGFWFIDSWSDSLSFLRLHRHQLIGSFRLRAHKDLVTKRCRRPALSSIENTRNCNSEVHISYAFIASQVGFAAAAPFVFKAVTCPLAGITADLLRRNLLATKTVRRLYYTTGAMTAGVFIVIAGYMKTPTLAIASMCVAGAGNGLVYAGFQVNMLDVAPRNASVVMGICNAIANTAGFLSPMLVGFITRNKTAAEWRTVFWTTFLVYSIGTLVFMVLLSDVRQQWDKVEEISKEPDTEMAVTTRK